MNFYLSSYKINLPQESGQQHFSRPAYEQKETQFTFVHGKGPINYKHYTVLQCTSFLQIRLKARLCHIERVTIMSPSGYSTVTSISFKLRKIFPF